MCKENDPRCSFNRCLSSVSAQVEYIYKADISTLITGQSKSNISHLLPL